MKYIVMFVAMVICGCATPSANDLPLTTPETFQKGLSRIDTLCMQGNSQGARAYVERHKDADPVIYWAFQVYLNGMLWDGVRHYRDDEAFTMRSYEEFLNAYEKKYLKRQNNNIQGTGEELVVP